MEQTITFADIPFSKRLEAKPSIGSAISISGTRLAIQEFNFLSMPVAHIFHYLPISPKDKKPWKWEDTVTTGYGDIHLHGTQLVSASRDNLGLQIHTLEEGRWTKVQEIPFPAGRLAPRFRGTGGKIAAAPDISDFGMFDFRFTRLYAVDRDEESLAWSLVEVAWLAGDSFWTDFDRKDDQIVASWSDSHRTATIFNKTAGTWGFGPEIPDNLPSGSVLDTKQRRRITFDGNDLVALRSTVSSPGKPSTRSILRFSASGSGGAWQKSSEATFKGIQDRITAVEGLAAIYSGPTDDLGNSKRAKLEIFNTIPRKIAAPKGFVENISSSEGRLATTDCYISNLGSPVSTGVRIYKIILPISRSAAN